MGNSKSNTNNQNKQKYNNIPSDHLQYTNSKRYQNNDPDTPSLRNWNQFNESDIQHPYDRLAYSQDYNRSYYDKYIAPNKKYKFKLDLNDINRSQKIDRPNNMMHNNSACNIFGFGEKNPQQTNSDYDNYELNLAFKNKNSCKSSILNSNKDSLLSSNSNSKSSLFNKYKKKDIDVEYYYRKSEDHFQIDDEPKKYKEKKEGLSINRIYSSTSFNNKLNSSNVSNTFNEIDDILKNMEESESKNPNIRKYIDMMKSKVDSLKKNSSFKKDTDSYFNSSQHSNLSKEYNNNYNNNNIIKNNKSINDFDWINDNDDYKIKTNNINKYDNNLSKPMVFYNKNDMVEIKSPNKREFNDFELSENNNTNVMYTSEEFKSNYETNNVVSDKSVEDLMFDYKNNNKMFKINENNNNYLSNQAFDLVNSEYSSNKYNDSDKENINLEINALDTLRTEKQNEDTISDFKKTKDKLYINESLERRKIEFENASPIDEFEGSHMYDDNNVNRSKINLPSLDLKNLDSEKHVNKDAFNQLHVLKDFSLDTEEKYNKSSDRNVYNYNLDYNKFDIDNNIDDNIINRQNSFNTFAKQSNQYTSNSSDIKYNSPVFKNNTNSNSNLLWNDKEPILVDFDSNSVENNMEISKSEISNIYMSNNSKVKKNKNFSLLSENSVFNSFHDKSKDLIIKSNGNSILEY